MGGVRDGRGGIAKRVMSRGVKNCDPGRERGSVSEFSLRPAIGNIGGGRNRRRENFG